MLLSRDDIRVMQLVELNGRQDLEEQLNEYHKLIDTLLYLNETLLEAKVQIKHWQKYSETLLFKFAFHGLTIHNILSGLVLKSNYYAKELNGITIIDNASAKVICRAQLETFLMYKYIYVNPKTDDEKELRYYAWIVSGLLQRQSFPTQTEFGKAQKLKDKEEIEKLKTKIQSLNSFNNLSDKQKKLY